MLFLSSQLAQVHSPPHPQIYKALKPKPYQTLLQLQLPIGPIVVPLWGSYVESYMVIPKGTTTGPMGET